MLSSTLQPESSDLVLAGILICLFNQEHVTVIIHIPTALNRPYDKTQRERDYVTRPIASIGVLSATLLCQSVFRGKDFIRLTCPLDKDGAVATFSRPPSKVLHLCILEALLAAVSWVGCVLRMCTVFYGGLVVLYEQ